MVQTRSGDRDAINRIGMDYRIGTTTTRVSAFKLGQVFALFLRLTPLRLAKLTICSPTGSAWARSAWQTALACEYSKRYKYVRRFISPSSHRSSPRLVPFVGFPCLVACPFIISYSTAVSCPRSLPFSDLFNHVYDITL